jgi:hypothetical protein
VLGFFLLPLAIFFGGLVGAQGNAGVGLGTFITTYLAGLAILRVSAGLSWKWILILVLGIPLVGGLEVLIWAQAVF